jgi:hypothetical protein
MPRRQREQEDTGDSRKDMIRLPFRGTPVLSNKLKNVPRGTIMMYPE